MPKPEKIDKVKELTERFKRATGAMFADFRGLTVKDATELRRTLRQEDASFAVVKNTLTRIAAREAGLDEALPLLEGPTAIAFMGGDAVKGAKAVLELGRRFPTLVVKGALIEGRILAEQDARALATIDTKEVSLAKVAGMLQAPLARTIYLLQAPVQRIAYALAERARQGGGEPTPEAA
jgi:large subunit ribosomal protein L10